jgi:hypothetical protein
MRCYNGCPDSELQALLDAQARARAELQAKLPGASATYFPMEEKWMVFRDLQPLTGFKDTLIAAVAAAIG